MKQLPTENTKGTEMEKKRKSEINPGTAGVPWPDGNWKEA